MLKKFLNKLLKKQEVYLTHASPNDDPHEASKMLNNALIIENAQKTAEINKFREKEALEQKRKSSKKAEEAIVKEAIKVAEERREKDKNSRINFFLSMDDEDKAYFLRKADKYPNFYFKSKKAYGKYVGFELKETENGYPLCFPNVLINGELHTLNRAVADPYYIFESPLGLVSQIRGGKVDSRYDSDGNKLFVLGGKGEVESSKIYILELKKKNDALLQNLNKAYSEISDYKEKEGSYNLALIGANSKLKSLEKEKEMAISYGNKAREEMTTIQDNWSNDLIEKQHSKLQQVLAEKALDAQKGALHEQLAKIGDLQHLDSMGHAMRVLHDAQAKATENLKSVHSVKKAGES